MADVRIAELLEQADRLRAKRSRWAAAIDNDGRQKIGDNLAGPSRDVGNGEVQRTRDVRGSKRFGREHIEKHGALSATRADELVPRNSGHSLIIARRTDCAARSRAGKGWVFQFNLSPGF